MLFIQGMLVTFIIYYLEIFILKRIRYNYFGEEMKSIKENIKNRKSIVKDLKRFYSDKVDDELKLLKKELGKDTFYAIKWENLLYKNLNEDELLRFIKDIRNIKTINNYSVNRENYFIRIKGYKRNEDIVVNSMCNIIYIYYSIYKSKLYSIWNWRESEITLVQSIYKIKN